MNNSHEIFDTANQYVGYATLFSLMLMLAAHWYLHRLVSSLTSSQREFVLRIYGEIVTLAFKGVFVIGLFCVAVDFWRFTVHRMTDV